MADRKEVSSAIPADIAERISDVGDGIVPTADEIETARGEIVETVMLFGQYPQPRRDGTTWPRVQFCLAEFISERESPDHEELAQFMVLALTDYSGIGAFADARARWVDEITAQLEAEFSDDNALVLERAQEIAEENDQARREAAEEGRRGL